MDLKKLSESPGEWLKNVGGDDDIIISTRIRLARNLQQYPFVHQLSETQRSAILERMRQDALQSLHSLKPQFVNLEAYGDLDLQLFVERQLISKEHAALEGPRGVVFPEDESYSVMMNEEDHLRIQVIKPGFQVEAAWKQISEIDEKLEEVFDFCFSSQFGYLTACPTNIGTGLRVSVMLHLPALSITKQFEKVCQQVQKVSLIVRGLYGEGTQASGHFYQISNQITLGQTEEELIHKIENVVPQIIKYERGVRETLMNENLVSLEDRVWRAYGILRAARSISSKETMELLSNLRLGVNLGILKEINLATINKIFLKSQPAHLTKFYGKEVESEERDAIRADFIRSELH
jgi:protein arginine kinase